MSWEDLSETKKAVVEKFSAATGIPRQFARQALDKMSNEMVTVEYFRMQVFGELYAKMLLTFLEDGKEHPTDDLYNIFVTSPRPKWRMLRITFNSLVDELHEKRVVEKSGSNLKIGEEGLRMLDALRKEGYNLEKIRREVSPLYQSPERGEVYQYLFKDY